MLSHGFNDSINAMVLQPDGKIIAAGQSQSDIVVARYTDKGALDTSFGNHSGIAITDLGGNADQAIGVVIQNSGKIVIGGHKQIYPNASGPIIEIYAMVRYQTDGTIDPTFGTFGKTILSPGLSNQAVALVKNSSDQMFLLGNGASTITAYQRDGALNTDFGLGGIVKEPLDALAFAATLSPDEQSLYVAALKPGVQFDFLAAKFQIVPEPSTLALLLLAALPLGMGARRHRVR